MPVHLVIRAEALRLSVPGNRPPVPLPKTGSSLADQGDAGEKFDSGLGSQRHSRVRNRSLGVAARRKYGIYSQLTTAATDRPVSGSRPPDAPVSAAPTAPDAPDGSRTDGQVPTTGDDAAPKDQRHATENSVGRLGNTASSLTRLTRTATRCAIRSRASPHGPVSIRPRAGCGEHREPSISVPMKESRSR